MTWKLECLPNTWDLIWPLAGGVTPHPPFQLSTPNYPPGGLKSTPPYLWVNPKLGNPHATYAFSDLTCNTDFWRFKQIIITLLSPELVRNCNCLKILVRYVPHTSNNHSRAEAIKTVSCWSRQIPVTGTSLYYVLPALPLLYTIICIPSPMHLLPTYLLLWTNYSGKPDILSWDSTRHIQSQYTYS